jgi:hypothetical protein
MKDNKRVQFYTIRSFIIVGGTRRSAVERKLASASGIWAIRE